MGGPTDQLQVTRRDDLLELSWSDAEEKLQGSIRPANPHAGQPIDVVIQVGSYEGAPFEGPVTVTLREAGAQYGDTVTVKRGERHWQTTFTPEHSGSYQLDVSFRTTRHKAVHAAFEVGVSPVPRMLGLGVLGVGVLLALGFGVHGLLRGDKPEQRTPVTEETAPAPETPSAPPASEAPPPPTTPAAEAPAAAPPVPEALATPAPAPEAPATPAPASESPVPGETEPRPPTPQ